MRVPLATAASIAQVKPATVRKWVQRGQLIRYDDGYDVKELLLWLDQRSTADLCARAGISDPAKVAAEIERVARGKKSA